MVERAVVRAAVVGPPLAASGGIGRLMSATLAALPAEEVECRVLDTRGSRSSPWSSLLPLLRSCATLLRLRARGEVDVAHVNASSHGSALRKGVVVRVCRLARVPVVLHLHASSFPEFFAPLPFPLRAWVRRTFGLADRVVVLGAFWRTYVEDVLGVPPENVTVLPNATGPAAVPASPRMPDEPLHVVFLGRLGVRKGVPELLEALADPRLRGRPWRATLAGDGEVDAYRAQAAALGLADRIVFTGWVDTEAVGALLADAHLLTLPSHAEGMPISVLEAFAAGVPVVSTPVGSLPEVVVDGVNGLVVPVGDASALAAAIVRLIDDEDLRARLGAGALTTWQRDHSVERYARRLVDEWQRAARTPGTASAAELLTPSRG